MTAWAKVLAFKRNKKLLIFGYILKKELTGFSYRLNLELTLIDMGRTVKDWDAGGRDGMDQAFGFEQVFFFLFMLLFVFERSVNNSSGNVE